MTESLGPDEEIPLDTLIERVKRQGGEAWANFKRRDFAPRERVESWRSDVARGDRARAFMAGDFWRKDLEPMLRAESRIKPLNPDALPDSLERATIEYLDKSGAARQAERIEKTMREWVLIGEKSGSLLKAEMEKRKSAGIRNG